MLLEREGELASLATLVENLDASGGKVVLVRGEAGVGKSALASAFVQSCSVETSAHIGTCDDLIIPQPLGPFWDIARSAPSLRGPLADHDRPGMLDAALRLLSRRPRPTIIVIEDTHWADEATLDAIRYLGRRMSTTNGVLVLTYRDGEVDYDHPLRGVIGDIPAQNLVRIQLEGLSLDAVATLLGESDLDPADVHATTRGNPFLVSAVASSEGGIHPTLEDAVVARVRRLSSPSQETLKLLAVIPEAISGEEALGLDGVDEDQLDECERHGLLDCQAQMVVFRHDLIRRAVEAAMTASERSAKARAVLATLPEASHPLLLIHLAVEVGDIDRLVQLVPRSARDAAAAGSHRESVEALRELGPHLDRLSSAELGRVLDLWAHEEFLVGGLPEAIRLNDLACQHYRESGERAAESRALAQAAQYQFHAGQRERAEALALDAIEVLGDVSEGDDLARALEVNAYLRVMAGDATDVPDLVVRTIEAGGPDIEEGILIRSLNHRGMAANMAHYPDGRASLDQARQHAEAAGDWFEEARALVNHASAAAEVYDLVIASDYARRALASALRHELPLIESNAMAKLAAVLALTGEWDEAADLARNLLVESAVIQGWALPVLGVIESRRGRASARTTLEHAWEMTSAAGAFPRLAPAAAAVAEHAWISATDDVPAADLRAVMDSGLKLGFPWSSGKIALWLWELGEIATPPAGIAEPFRLVMEGQTDEAAAIWETKGAPYERALALMHGSDTDQLQALESFEDLGATAVAAKLRRHLRDRGMSVPRGKGRETRRHAAGLTARQAEVLQLLDEDLTNLEIADRLFISRRTAENHVSAVLFKLDVSTRDEAVSRARSDGYIGVAVQGLSTAQGNAGEPLRFE